MLQVDGAACWVVADGLGGHHGGEEASRTAVAAALASFRERPDTTDAVQRAHPEGARRHPRAPGRRAAARDRCARPSSCWPRRIAPPSGVTSATRGSTTCRAAGSPSARAIIPSARPSSTRARWTRAIRASTRIAAVCCAVSARTMAPSRPSTRCNRSAAATISCCARTDSGSCSPTPRLRSTHAAPETPARGWLGSRRASPGARPARRTTTPPAQFASPRPICRIRRYTIRASVPRTRRRDLPPTSRPVTPLTPVLSRQTGRGGRARTWSILTAALLLVAVGVALWQPALIQRARAWLSSGRSPAPATAPASPTPAAPRRQGARSKRCRRRRAASSRRSPPRPRATRRPRPGWSRPCSPRRRRRPQDRPSTRPAPLPTATHIVPPRRRSTARSTRPLPRRPRVKRCGSVRGLSGAVRSIAKTLHVKGAGRDVSHIDLSGQRGSR